MIRKNLAFILLTFLFFSAAFALGTVARAESTIVRSDGSIQTKSYKPSYMVRNNVVLQDIHFTPDKPLSRRTLGRTYNVYPGSHIKTWKFNAKSQERL